MIRGVMTPVLSSSLLVPLLIALLPGPTWSGKTIIKLKGGNATTSDGRPSEGNLYVNKRPVCDDLWSINDANIVCRQLGFFRAKNATTNSHFGNVTSDFGLDDVSCRGDEKDIKECRFAVRGNCDIDEGAGVICDTQDEATINDTIAECFSANISFVNSSSADFDITVSAYHCQELCRSRVMCERFTYFSANGKCFTKTGDEKRTTEGAISGPQKCNIPESSKFAPDDNCLNPGEVCLRGGSGFHDGNVFVGGRPVCDDGWNMFAANIVCKQLRQNSQKYYRAESITTGSHFGQVSGNFSLDDVSCIGKNRKISDCKHSSVDDCDGLEAAGVICDTRAEEDIKREEKQLVDSCFVNDVSYAYFNPIQNVNGSALELRLVGGSGPHEGNVHLGGKPVCDDGWGREDAEVVCRQLGFGVLNFTRDSFFGNVDPDHAMDEVGCTGAEAKLLDCPHRSNEDCGSSEGAGVICDKNPPFFTVQSVHDCQTYCRGQDSCHHFSFDRETKKCYVASHIAETKHNRTGAISGPRECLQTPPVLPRDNCSDSNVVCLSGGSKPSEGNVFIGGKAVCDDSWNMTSANVVCRELGYFRALNSTTGSHFGVVKKSFSPKRGSCNGMEESILECPLLQMKGEACDGGEAAGVVCDTGNYTLNLRGGEGSHEGNVFLGNQPVCDDLWDLNDTAVVCRQLGFGGYVKQTRQNHFGSVGTSDYAMDNVECLGNETSLGQCVHQSNDNCGNKEGAGVVCDTRPADEIETERMLIDDCFIKGWAFASHLQIDNTTVPSVTECQNSCKSHENCTHFSYLFGECIRTSGNKKIPASEMALSGPRECTPHTIPTYCKRDKELCLGGDPGNSAKHTWTGNVFVSGRPVCDDGWNILAANIVCKQNGWYRAKQAITQSFFGKVSANFSMDDVVCYGNETKIEDCKHNTDANCDSSEAAGVICENRDESVVKAEDKKREDECFVKDTTFNSTSVDTKWATNPVDCQEHCQARGGCSHFTFIPQSGECRLMTVGGDCKPGIAIATISARHPVAVPCDDAEENDDNTGSWIVMQRRGQFGYSPRYFTDKLWADYQRGFGSPHDEFWIGLDNLATLTGKGQWEMRVDLTDWDGKTYFALYDKFKVGPAPLYRLSISDFYPGSTLGDSMAGGSWTSNGMGFSTRDNDNDNIQGSCAVRMEGAWWYNNCQRANLNAINYPQQENNGNFTGIYWKFGGTRGYTTRTFRQAQMKIRKKGYKPGCDSSDQELSLIGSYNLMRSHGWKFDFTDSLGVHEGVGNQCKQNNGKDAKWFGWSGHSLVGTLSAIFAGSGEVTIDFGNCWDEGNVKVYLNSKLMATAPVGKKSVITSFPFTPGSVLEIKDEDGNAVVMLNSISVKCDGGNNKLAVVGTISGPSNCVEIDSLNKYCTGDFCLSGGGNAYEGNVMVNERAVCDDFWTMANAQVVCKQLKYSRAIRATTNSWFGTVLSQFAMDDVNCTGTETALNDCEHSTRSNCDGGEAAGVVCDPRSEQELMDEDSLIIDCFVSNMSYSGGFQMLHDAVSVTECQRLCKNEANCSHFSYASNKERSCVLHTDVDDFKVVSPGMISGPKGCLEPSKAVKPVSSTCSDGARVCLGGDTEAYKGNVFVDGKPVCDDHWTFKEANVVCNQLGFFKAKQVFTKSKFGPTSADFSMDDVFCNGDESNITDCSYNLNDNCDSYEAAGVECDTADEAEYKKEEQKLLKECYKKDTSYIFINDDIEKSQRLRLIGGEGPFEGNVMIGNLPVCDSDWDETDGEIVCRQLGYEYLVKVTKRSAYGLLASEKNFIPAIGNVGCNGSETMLTNCRHSRTICSAFDAAGVTCRGDPFRHKVASVLDCHKMCQNRSQCNHFTFDTKSSTCFLSNLREKTVARRPNTISGPKNCSEAGEGVADECQNMEVLGLDYRGNQSVTATGRICQNWSAQSPHNHTQYTDTKRKLAGLGDHNMCRNPDGEEQGVWCYTVSVGVRWEYCGIPPCKGSSSIWTYTEPVQACVFGHNDKIYGGVSLAECKRKCSSSAAFVCNSLDYIEPTQRCYLSQETKLTQPGHYQTPCSGDYVDAVYMEKKRAPSTPSTTSTSPTTKVEAATKAEPSSTEKLPTSVPIVKDEGGGVTGASVGVVVVVLILVLAVGGAVFWWWIKVRKGPEDMTHLVMENVNNQPQPADQGFTNPFYK